MNNVINYAAPPRVRRLMADYKDRAGRDFHQELVTIHSPGATDASLVDSIREALTGRGCILTALLEFLNDGSHRALYLGRGYLEEYMNELGLTMPDDLAAAMTAAGIHPVNWEELTHGR